MNTVEASAPAAVAGVTVTKRPTRSPWVGPPVIAAALITGALVLVGFLTTALTGADSPAATWVYDLAQLTAALLATLAAATAVGRHRGRERRGWMLVTLACASWSIGQLYWSYVELLRGEDPPQVSFADPFYLAFIVLMVFAVAPTGGQRSGRLRTLLDAFIIGMSLFTISWTTTISQLAVPTVYSSDPLGTVINLAYPCGDVVVLTMVILSVSRRTARRASITAVAGAMGLIAISDAFYFYLTLQDDYDAGSLVGLGWVAGFGLIACAALASEPSSTVVDAEDPDGAGRLLGARAASALPYIPLVMALVVVGIQRVESGPDQVNGLLLIATFLGVLARQYLTIRDNAVLTRHLASRENELQRQAFEDVLTGLPNRALFTDRVAHALEQHRRSLRPLALLFVDLDDFKVVNDTLGHPVGDELVIRVAERLRGSIRSSDTVARFGGDEFAVLVEGDVDGVEVGARLVESLRTQFTLGKEQLSIGASIGIAEVTGEQQTPSLDELYSRADIAMYAAKRSGKGQLALYESSMVLPEAADLQYRPLLIDAIKSGTIECVFQPILDLETGRVHCMEALARWRVDGHTVNQDYFIKLAGRLKLLTALTDLMVDKACAQLADWSQRLGCHDVRVGVNVSPGQMTDRDFPRRIESALRRHGLSADRLVLEITEDALIGEAAVAQAVADQLRRAGVRLWLDDFGTGYSSLLSLRQISLQAVKIDIAFVANIHTDPSAKRFLRALLALGRDLDLLVTAEGVELPEQAAVLRSLGCQFVQGFLYARPAPGGELDEMLRASVSGQDIAASPLDHAGMPPALPVTAGGVEAISPAR